jgi:hypothetical protein
LKFFNPTNYLYPDPPLVVTNATGDLMLSRMGGDVGMWFFCFYCAFGAVCLGVFKGLILVDLDV